MRHIRVMISSRCNDTIDLFGEKQELTDLRREMKKQLESYKPFGKPLFECWINEDSPPTEGSQDSWDTCLEQVRKCDLLIVLYNGNAGWSATANDIGICHAELAEGLATGAAKVFTFKLPMRAPRNARDRRFRAFYEKQSRFRVEVPDGDGVLDKLPATIHEALVELVRLGGMEARKGKFDTGDALDWSRLSMAERQAAMVGVQDAYLRGLPKASPVAGGVFLNVAKKKVLFCTHAIPGGLAIPAARELVGRPFHNDHELASVLRSAGGPVHIIACHKGATEAQAARLLGHSDAVFVSTSFGIYAADEVHKIQFLLLAQCRDETSTRHALGRAFAWLESAGESEHLARRALSRRAIVKSIANEN